MFELKTSDQVTRHRVGFDDRNFIVSGMLRFGPRDSAISASAVHVAPCSQRGRCLPRKPFRLPGFAFLVCLTLASRGADADTFRVGSGAGCTHTLAGAFLGSAISAGGDTILIAEPLTWTGSNALNLTNEAAITIRGAVSCTNDAAAQKNISMTQGDLFEFVNTSVTLRDVGLIANTNGGRPIAAVGSASTIILDTNTLLSRGKALWGGNVHLSEGASLITQAGAQVNAGEALFGGGGIYCLGAGQVFILAGSTVFNNQGPLGGGIYAAGGCTVTVVAGRPGGVFFNEAGNGGGIYGASGATINVFGSSATPASLRSNRADVSGGAIYVTGTTTTANVLASEIWDNRAGISGAGFYVTGGADLLMDQDLPVCARGFRCSLLALNFSESPTGTTEGGAVFVTGGGKATIRRTYVTGNRAMARHGGNVGLVEGASSILLMEGDILYDNAAFGAHVLARDGGRATVAYSSVWGSSTSGVGMTFLEADDDGTVELLSSVVIEGNGEALEGGGLADHVMIAFAPNSTGVADCVIVHMLEFLPPTTTAVVEADPADIWIDPASGDPRLRADADAIDFCDTDLLPPVVPPRTDIEHELRGADAPPANRFGPYDLGADEWYAASSTGIFSDGFESGNTSAWSATVP